MNRTTIISYVVPLLLACLVFISNFLDTKLFQPGEMSFAVWFVLSAFCFVCGTFMNKSFGWHTGAKVIFSVIVSTSIVSIGAVAFFREYFQPQMTSEILILYALRNVFLGTMGFFGMSIDEVKTLQVRNTAISEKLQFIEETIKDTRKESDLIIREAQVRANKIINEADLSAKNTILRKERIEREIREFIQIEKELVRKYEEK